MNEGDGETAKYLGELLDLCRESLNGLEVPKELPNRCLGGLIALAYQHADALLSLAATRHDAASSVVLRALLEAWINAKYILQEDSNTRAASYVLRSQHETLKFLRRLRDLEQSKPEGAPNVLGGAGVASIEELDARMAQTIEALERNKDVPRFPSVEQRAAAIGFEAEWTYASVYSFLFSEQVHAGPLATLRFTTGRHPSLTDEARVDHAERTLATAYSFFLDLLTLASENLDKPSAAELAPFDAYRPSVLP